MSKEQEDHFDLSLVANGGRRVVVSGEGQAQRVGGRGASSPCDFYLHVAGF